MLKYDELIKNINILLADDDEDYMMITDSFLKTLGYNVDKATDGKQALEMLKTNKYQIALLDYFMPELNGEEVVSAIRETNQELIIILQTGFSGKKPPIDTMKKLNIQNYHDKTEGIDRLNLELISAVKIFNQQNEIQLKKFKSDAIGALTFGVAQEIKKSLLSVGAGMEFTNMLIQESKSNDFDKETVGNMTKYYENNKKSLELIDQVLSAIINQSTENSNYIMSDKEVIDIIQLVLAEQSKSKNISLQCKVALKTNSYIQGGINDAVFMICDILKRLMALQESGSSITVTLAEDEEKWYLYLTSPKINTLSASYLYLISNVVLTLEKTNIEKLDNELIVSITK